MVYENKPLIFISQDTLNTSEINELLCNYGGFKAFGVLTALKCYIGRTGCYYVYWNRSAKLDFLHTYYNDMSLDKGLAYVDEIVKFCIRTNIFDKQKFELYNILTCESVQQNFCEAIPKRTYVYVNKNFVLNSIYAKYGERIKKGVEKTKKGNFSKQSEGKESQRENEDINNKERDNILPLIEKFKKELPNKLISGNGKLTNIPSYVDMDFLIEKVKSNHWLLNETPNFTLEYMCKEEIYNKIKAGFYDKRSPLIKDEKPLPTQLKIEETIPEI